MMFEAAVKECAEKGAPSIPYVDDFDYFTNIPMDVERVKLEPVEGFILEYSIQLDTDAVIEPDWPTIIVE